MTTEFYAESELFKSPPPSDLPLPNFGKCSGKNTIIMNESYKSNHGKRNVKEAESVIATDRATVAQSRPCASDVQQSLRTNT